MFSHETSVEDGVARKPLVRGRTLGIVIAIGGVLSGLALIPVGRRDEASTSSTSGGPSAASGSPPAQHGSQPTTNGPARAVYVGPVIESDVVGRLHAFARKPAKHVSLQRSALAKAQAVMRSWVGRAMALDKADKRVSKRFLRTSYGQDLERDAPMFLSDRAGADGSFATAAAERTNDAPVRTLYRESDDGSYMKFQKLRETSGPAGDGLLEGDAQASAESFFVENGMITPNAVDAISGSEVRARRIDEGDLAQQTAQDYLAQQDVILKRSYEGKPVLNSVASVSVLPDTGEVVIVKVANWTPTEANGESSIKPAYDSGQAQALTAELEQKLKDTLAQELGNEANTAVVKGVEEAWYQTTDDGLIPVLMFEVETQPDGASEPRTTPLLMNPYGDNTVIWEHGRVPHESAPG